MTEDQTTQRADRYFEEIAVGESVTIDDARTVTEADIMTFAGLTGDFHPHHVSESYADKTWFGERVAHGNLVFGMTEGIVSEALPRNAYVLASYGHDHLRFVNPVQIGDSLSVNVTIVEKDEYDENRGLVVRRYETKNQRGETVLVDDHMYLVEKRPRAGDGHQ